MGSRIHIAATEIINASHVDFSVTKRNVEFPAVAKLMFRDVTQDADTAPVVLTYEFDVVPEDGTVAFECDYTHGRHGPHSLAAQMFAQLFNHGICFNITH